MRQVFRGAIILAVLVTLAVFVVQRHRELLGQAADPAPRPADQSACVPCQLPAPPADATIDAPEPTPAVPQTPTLAPPQPSGEQEPVQQAVYLSVETEQPEIEVVLIDP